jgi:hypothetical protein
MLMPLIMRMSVVVSMTVRMSMIMRMSVRVSLTDRRQSEFAHFTVHVYLTKLGFDFAIAQHMEKLGVQSHFGETGQLNVRVKLLLLVHNVENLFNERTRKQEIGQHYDPLRFVQTGTAEAFFETGMGNANKASFDRVIAAAFPHHPRHFINVTVGIGVA